MAAAKITITLPLDQLKEIRALVAAGRTASVSGFVNRAVKIALQDVTEWDEMLESALNRTGGPLTKQEEKWADAILTGEGRKKRSRRRKAA